MSEGGGVTVVTGGARGGWLPGATSASGSMGCSTLHLNSSHACLIIACKALEGPAQGRPGGLAGPLNVRYSLSSADSLQISRG